MRADDRRGAWLEPGSIGEAARITVKSRAPVEIGETVEVEVSFGPLADEIVLEGSVRSVQPSPDGRSPRVVISFDRSQADRVRYVRQVLDGNRKATARRDRRIPVDLPVTWRWGAAEYDSRLKDLSRGGAFIASTCLPTIGSKLDVEIKVQEDALQFDAVVSWIRDDEGDTGFGVNFKHESPAAAARLTKVVRSSER